MKAQLHDNLNKPIVTAHVMGLKLGKRIPLASCSARAKEYMLHYPPWLSLHMHLCLIFFSFFIALRRKPPGASWETTGAREQHKKEKSCICMHGHPDCPLLKWSRNNSQAFWVGEFPEFPVFNNHSPRHGRRFRPAHSKVCTSHGHNRKTKKAMQAMHKSWTQSQAPNKKINDVCHVPCAPIHFILVNCMFSGGNLLVHLGKPQVHENMNKTNDNTTVCSLKQNQTTFALALCFAKKTEYKTTCRPVFRFMCTRAFLFFFVFIIALWRKPPGHPGKPHLHENK